MPACKWVLDRVYSYYDTSCGNAFSFSHDEPFEDGKFRFCPYCGRKIKQKDNLSERQLQKKDGIRPTDEHATGTSEKKSQ